MSLAAKFFLDFLNLVLVEQVEFNHFSLLLDQSALHFRQLVAHAHVLGADFGVLFPQPCVLLGEQLLPIALRSFTE